MKQKMFSRILTAILAILLIASLYGCRNQQEDPGLDLPDTTDPGTCTEPNVTEETTEPEEEETTEPEPIAAGVMQSHPNGKNGDLGIYFKLEPNQVPYDDWNIEYRPQTLSAIELYRDGETYKLGNTTAPMIVKYSETEYYLKLEQWIIGKYFPIRDGDVLKVDGVFHNSTHECSFAISTSYIAVDQGLVFFSTEYPEGSNVNLCNAGYAGSHANGKTTEGIYFSMAQNRAPYKDNWSLEYFPTEASCVQLIRNGNTYNIANPAAGTVVKYGPQDYYLKLEKWIIKDYYPIKDGDIIVLKGKFTNSGTSTVLNISKTYIAVEEGLLSFSKDYPTESGVEAILIPTMQDHPNGFTGTGFYFKADANELPFNTDWSLEYFPREASCLKLIRDGQTYDIGNINAGTIVKYSETEYYFKLDNWMYPNYIPFTDGDILVIEGKFVNAGMAGLMEVGKTYAAINSGMIYLSTEMPSGPVGPEKIDGGNMSAHADGWNSDTNGGLYFTLAENNAPLQEDWGLRYTPTAASAIKLIREGVTYDVAHTGAEMLVKYGPTDYYLEFWPISQKPITEGDILVIEGSFANATNNVVLNIAKTYVTIENGVAVFSDTLTETIQAGVMSSHANGWNTGSNDGMYFTLAENIVPYHSDWSIEYSPVTMNAIKLCRDGQTYDIANIGRGTIVKFGATEYYLRLSAWTIGDYALLQPGDQLIVDGEFTNADNGTTFRISNSLVTLDEGYVLIFGEQEEEEDSVLHTGVLQPHTESWSIAMNRIFFTLAENEIPVYEDADVEYYPAEAGALKLLRDGQVYEIGLLDRGLIIKRDATTYSLELSRWSIGDYALIQAGDVLAIEGLFLNPYTGVSFYVDATTITVAEDMSLTFTEGGLAEEEPETTEPETTEPEVTEPENDGPLQAHADNGWTATGGLYFTMAENDASYNDWNIRYTPTAASNVKLIRGGVTYDVAHTARETICKFSATEYYYEFWTLDTYKPVQAGDVMIVEGEFVNAASGDSLTVAKTTITFLEDGTAIFESETTEPEVTEPEVTEPEAEGLPLLAWSEKGWNTGGNNGLWFTMDANDIPADSSWATEYTPVSADALKLVRDGQTVSIGHPGRGTVIKATEAEYYLKLDWCIGDYSGTITVGDQLIVEGDFTNATNGVTFTVKKTIITIGEDYVLTFQVDA